MKKKNGFTLIELLAVIVILAIIALIATPLVLKYIEKSREGAFSASIDSAERAAEIKVMQLEKDGKAKYPYTINIQDLDLKHKEKLSGTITVKKEETGEYVFVYDVTDGIYSIVGDKDSEVEKTENLPKIKFKNGTGKVDNVNNYIYSFVNTNRDYSAIDLADYIETENGSVEFEKNSENNYSTGAKVILKDKDGKTHKTYQIVIFGDVNNDGYINLMDASEIERHVGQIRLLDETQQFAADMNRDGKVNYEDSDIALYYSAYHGEYNQITNLLIINEENPQLKFKTENGKILYNVGKYVYSFYNDNRGYTTMDLANYIEAKNGSVVFEKNASNTYSTGAKITLNDTDGELYDTYQVVIFGDIDGDGLINVTDLGYVNHHIANTSKLSEIQFKAADMNNDGLVTQEDADILTDHVTSICLYNQINNTCK